MKNVKNANDISAVIVACMSLLVMTAIYVYSCDTNDTLNQLEVPTIDQLNNTAQESKYAYDITSVEREMLARLVYREANTESIECQEAIVSVVINRWQDGRWGNTLKEVVYAKISLVQLIYYTALHQTKLITRLSMKLFKMDARYLSMYCFSEQIIIFNGRAIRHIRK